MHPFVFVISWFLPLCSELEGNVLLSLLTGKETVAPKTVWLCMYIRQENIQGKVTRGCLLLAGVVIKIRRVCCLHPS